MNPTTDPPDDPQFEALLASANRDAAPPDSAFLDRLREQSTAVFLASSPQSNLPKKGRFMATRTLGALAASVAAVLLVSAGLYWYLEAPDAEPAFGRVLDNVAKTQTIHFQVTRNGETFEAWAEKPGRLRLSAPDGTYEIAQDGQLWQVDEKTNRAIVLPSPYHRSGDKHELDLLALLPYLEWKRAEVADVRPSEHMERDGIDSLVYRVEMDQPKVNLKLEALVDPQTGLPRSLEVREKGNGGRLLGLLTMLAYDEPVPKDKFVVKDTLTEDGRVGNVADTQGVVAVKPVLHQRWSPVSSHLLLKPGDYLRTDPRGANAAALRLVPRTRVILGPGTIVEVIKPDQIRLIEGQAEFTVPAGATLEVLGHGEEKVVVKGAQHYRLDKEKLVKVAQEPGWLKAFKGTTTSESLGSLIAGVDGRNVPLTVGEHKVSVDIRDQIARTTIEETFVNHTNGVLEGVFHFPLPAGASISGFAMWIGDNMIEADVVEKQRAREIYETILLEKRDPGLLEWTGGNIFKARVYPIFGNSEKRIRITYTQVLPFKNGSYRYSYGLQSDMLQQTPLRELAIDVKVNSAMPLKSVTCPTHPARLGKTAHSAHVEFAAQQYTPARDFEVVVEVEGRVQGGQGPTETVMISHRRDEDGYFMLQVAPPTDDKEGWSPGQRDILNDGKPLHLLLLADTSASMDAGQRKVQSTFLATLLTALTPKDTLNVAACDVECDWVFEKSVPATSANIATVREFLARRTSLGWTDLDRAFTSALQKSGPDTQVVYIGDGIVTSGDGDAVAFSKRLRNLYDEKGKPGSFHAVTTGSSYESGVLQAIASLGGGSVRHVSGAQGPAAVALELLGEMTSPTLRDLKVEFRGLRTASVYPERLPNLAAGAQQILLGRYLPEGRDQVGEVIVTGTRAGVPVRFSTRVPLADAEKGNSFIPRLWARMHLDHLLEQGGAPAIQAEIIALSEEYNILTPYTSLLVLESDADRERFKVKTRFRMRDGERFFADGRDNANYELKQQQMKRAGDWRIGMHRRVLSQLAGLGRDLRRLPGFHQEERRDSLFDSRFALGLTDLGAAMDYSGLGEMPVSGGKGPWGRERGSESSPYSDDSPGEEKDLSEPGEPSSELDDRKKETEGKDYPEPDGEVREWYDSDVKGLKDLEFGDLGRSGGRKKRLEGQGEYEYFARDAKSRLQPRSSAIEARRSLTALFPVLPRAAVVNRQKPTWPAAALALAQSLRRTEQLGKLQGGLEIAQQADGFDPRWGELTTRSRQRTILSSKAWLTRSGADAEGTLVQWCDGRERGVFSRAFQLGRVRPIQDGDLANLPLDLGDFSLSGLDQFYNDYTAAVEAGKDGETVLVFTDRNSPRSETRVVIDAARHVITRMEHRHDGKTTSVAKFEDFVEAAGCWWARRIETQDDKGRLSSRTTRTVQPLAADDLAKKLKEGLAGRDEILFLQGPAISVASAKQALKADKATFNDHFALMVHFAFGQQWARAKTHLEQCEKLAAGKPGLRFLQNEFLVISRRHEEIRKRLLEEAGRLTRAEPVHPDELVLAEYLLAGSASILEANERLSLLDTLKPIYSRQPAHRHSVRNWTHQRLVALQQAGQQEEALRVMKQLATESAHDAGIQQQYAQSLASAGDYPGAYAWLDRILAGEPRWLPHEEESLWNMHAQLLEGQGRYPELVDYLSAWIKKNPDSASPYAQYLGALVRTDRLAKANDLVAQWLREGQTPEAPTPAAAARLQAAISLTLGQGHNLYTNRIEERWLAPLAEAGLFLARHEARASDAGTILSAYQFRQTEEGHRVGKALLTRLAAEVLKLSPAQIQHHLDWIARSEPEAEQGVWNRIGDALQERWTAETDPERKHQLGISLLQVLAQHDTPVARIAFLHARLKKAPPQYRLAYVGELFNALLQQPWSAEYEDEAFTLLDQLSDAESENDRLTVQAPALHRLTDRMIAARQTDRMKALEHPEKLTRTELKKKQEEALKLARTGFADHLRAVAAKQRGPLTPWLKVEQYYLDVRLERDLDKVAAACWESLGAAPKKTPEADEEQDGATVLEDLLRDRHLLMVMHLAVRKGAAPTLADRLRKYLDQGVALEEESSQWKQLTYWLLIAQDRPKDLEKVLQKWVAAGDADNRWRMALGYVLAEQGRVPEAIKLLEAIESSDELGPTAYRTLADWYLAADRREQHDRARVASYRATDEWQLQRMLYARLRPWQRTDGHLPTEIDRDILFQFTALFEKSSAPQNHLNLLREYYQLTRDFRLLTGLADSVVGHSAGGVYPFLTGARTVLGEVGDEATVDELVLHLAKVRARAKTEVDRRALDLLDMMAHRRAAELKNQGGPHRDAALAALQRAFKGEWSPGEPRLMADLLADLGVISQAPLAREQIRQLEVLHRQEARGSYDRLHIAHRLAMTQAGYNRTDDALTLLESALKEYEEANKGVLPTTANNALGAYVSLLEGARHHDRGEKVLFDQMRHPVNEQQRLWLTLRLNQLYHHALVNAGEVSLGRGRKLYQALERKLRAELATHDHNHRFELIQLLCTVYRAADDQKMEGVRNDLKAFARDHLPEVLKHQSANYQNIVNHVAQSIRNILGPAEAIEFLIDQIEREPAWFRLSNQDGWSQFGWSIAQWRAEAKDVGELEKRLLPWVLAEERRDLESGQQRIRIIYYRQNAFFWSEKEAEFARVADDVLSKRPQSGVAALYIAQYLYHGLNRTARAIEVLSAAHKLKLLDESGQVELAQYLQWQNRHAESIPLLEPLVERGPENLSYRIMLLSAYFHANRSADLLALLKKTDTFFHQKDRWTESVMAGLGGSCLDNQLYAQSVAYYNEAIPLHQRTYARQGVGDGTLSTYYAQLARAWAGQGKTAEAVEAANGAIVSWGPTHQNRAQALEALRQILREAKDLDGYVAAVDRKTASTGLDSAIVRKALGQVYMDKADFPKAVTQLSQAIALQTNDAETHRMLIDCFNKMNNKDGAILALLDAVQVLRRDIGLYKDLGARLRDQPKEAERAYTSIVEVLPSESESHALLAEVRQEQGRWGEAISQWEQVARIRALEPTGLLKLAQAQIHEKIWDGAAQTVVKLKARTWPARFGDVGGELRKLEDQIKTRKSL
jgi:predicted Zn-dependent protease